jgi:NAD(P)-dependent dehydrogenase (short-subunit alcohol dehydrogenase family)
MRLAGKVAIITGSGSGIGAAGARVFASEGAKVLVVDIDRERAAGTAREIGSKAAFAVADTSRSNEMAQVVEQAVATFGRLDIMWNNAGIHSEGTAIHETDETLFDRIIAVNMKSAWLGIRFAVRQFLAQRTGGAIINTASISAIRGIGGQGAHGAAKAAVCQLTRIAAVEYASFGIRCNAILPGAVLTPLQARPHGTPDTRTPEEIADAMRGAQPLPRVGRPEDIAAAAVYLASDEAGFVTGTSMVVDGGRTIHLPHRRPGRAAFDYLPELLTTEHDR